MLKWVFLKNKNKNIKNVGAADSSAKKVPLGGNGRLHLHLFKVEMQAVI